MSKKNYNENSFLYAHTKFIIVFDNVLQDLKRKSKKIFNALLKRDFELMMFRCFVLFTKEIYSDAFIPLYCV